MRQEALGGLDATGERQDPALGQDDGARVGLDSRRERVDGRPDLDARASGHGFGQTPNHLSSASVSTRIRTAGPPDRAQERRRRVSTTIAPLAFIRGYAHDRAGGHACCLFHALGVVDEHYVDRVVQIRELFGIGRDRPEEGSIRQKNARQPK